MDAGTGGTPPPQTAGAGRTPPVQRPQENSRSVENVLERLRAQQAQQHPPTGTAPLTQGEIRGLAEQIGECFSVDAGMLALQDIVIELRVRLDGQGNVREVVPGDRGVPNDARSRALYESARRALLSPQCNPLRVPTDKHRTIMESTFRFRTSGLVAAPLMTVGLPVDLPRTNAPPLPQEQEPLTVTVDSRGRVFLQETEVEMSAMVAQLQAIRRNQPPGHPERHIFIRGDRAISYGRLMEVMGAISAAGFSRVVLLAEQPQSRAATPASPPPAQPTPRH